MSNKKRILTHIKNCSHCSHSIVCSEDAKIKIQSVTHSVSDKVTYWAVLDSLKSLLGMYSIIWIWLQDDLDTRASKLRSQKWSRYHLRGSDWKVNPFLKGSGDCAKSCSNRQKSPFFSKAGETAILNCSFYLHSDNLYSVKWYKVLYNFSFFLSKLSLVLP